MPYASVKDLPAAQTMRYTPKQKRAFLAAFNSAAADGQDESSCFRIAHHAAKAAGK